MELETTIQLLPSLLPRPASTLSAAEQRVTLADIKSKIIRYKDYLAALEKEQREVEDSLALVVYPALTLPNEITSQIFVACLPEDGRVTPSPHTAPLLLAQICRHWRNIATSTCELWCSVHLDIPARGDQHACLLLDSWFARAKGYSLSLSLSSNYYSIPETPAELLTFISAYSEQIQHLELRLENLQFQQFHALQTPFPRLQHLTTSTPQLSDPDLQDLVKRSPALRQLHLTCTNSTGNSLPDPLLMNSLTNLDIHASILIETFLGVLENFPLLTHVKCNIDFDDFSPPEPARYPYLHSLSVSSPCSISILDFLTLPNLRHLELFDDYLDDGQIVTFQDFLSRSSCTLDHLAIGFDPDTPHEHFVMQCLESLQSVEILNIHSFGDLNSFTVCLDERHILPRLRHIEITSMRADIDHESLVAVLRWRTDPIQTSAPLQSFHVTLQYMYWGAAEDRDRVWPPGNLALPALEGLVADGLDFFLALKEDSGRMREHYTV